MFIFRFFDHFSSLLLLFFREDKSPIIVDNAHEEDINAISFNPVNEYMVATGSSDHVICFSDEIMYDKPSCFFFQTVRIWDTRHMKEKTPINTCEAHSGAVWGVSWSPHNESLLASFGDDRRVCVWDLARIGDEQDPEDAEDGPPELLVNISH